LAAWTAATGQATAQSQRKDRSLRPDEKANALLARIREKNHVPGLVGAILKGDSLVAIGAAGVRKDGSMEPIQVGDQVHIGSCTKTMTATRIAMLVEHKKLKWQSRILDLFPDLKDTIHRDFQKVTLADLLTHRSGLPRDGPYSEFDANLST